MQCSAFRYSVRSRKWAFNDSLASSSSFLLLLYDFNQHHALAFHYGDDPGAMSLAYLGVVLWLLGYPDKALKKSNKAVTLSRRIAYPFSLSTPFTTAAVVVSYFRLDTAAVQLCSNTLLELATEQEFAHMMAVGTTHQGWAIAHRGHVLEGIEQMRQGLAAWCDTGAKLILPYCHTGTL